MAPSITQTSNGKKSDHSPWKKHIVFWPVYCYWLTLIIAAILWLYASEYAQSTGTYPIAPYYYKAIAVKNAALIFIPICIGSFLYYYFQKNFQTSAIFGGHLVAMWLLTPIMKQLFFFFILFVQILAQ